MTVHALSFQKEKVGIGNMVKKNHEMVEVEGYLVHETGERPGEGAYLVRVEGDKKVWLPKIATEKHPTGKPNFFIFEIPEELALDKGLI